MMIVTAPNNTCMMESSSIDIPPPTSSVIVATAVVVVDDDDDDIDINEGQQQKNGEEEGEGKNNLMKSVSFKNVEIREYTRCLGIHPTTTNGPSLSIDWTYEQLDTLDLEDYEQNRSTRRCIKQLQIPSGLRARIIQEHTSCTKKDINNNIREVNITKHQRKMCLALQEYEPYHIIYERLVRKMKRLTSRSAKKHHEQELLWEDYGNRSSDDGDDDDDDYDDLKSNPETILTDNTSDCSE